MTCCAACVDRGLQEKLAFVAIDDDPEKGFVYEAAEVRKEAANIGRQTQEGYLNDDPSPELAFEALMEHFMEKQEELKAPGSTEAFDLSTALTFGLFEEQLFAYTRYKSVGAKVKGAVSSLELVRRLDAGTRRAYFKVAKT